ncbi:MAG: bactofilin family protein [Burkholderiaceae bacterium]
MFNKSKPTNDNADDIDDTPRILGGGDTAPTRGGNRAESLLDSGPRPSVVSEGFSIRGEIDARGALHVQGSVSGQVKVDELTVGNSGELEGTVACVTLTIKGRFSGTAVCSELLVRLQPAWPATSHTRRSPCSVAPRYAASCCLARLEQRSHARRHDNVQRGAGARQRDS